MDYLIGALILLAVIFAVRKAVRNSKKGGCAGCDACDRYKNTGCAGCRYLDEKPKK